MSAELVRTKAYVERLADRMMRFHGIPGVQIAVTNRDRTLWTSSRGRSDLASGDQVSSQTLFQIGSVSKSFTSIVLLQLQEEGLLDIDTPVSRYLPWVMLKSKWGPVTLKHLMSHSAGIIMGNDFSLSAFGEAMAINGMEVSAKPGTFFHYSNTGYKILGLVIEELLNEPNGIAVEKRILRPLGMGSSSGTISNDSRKRHSTGHTAFYDDRPQPPGCALAPSVWFESETADGSISSTASDMAIYLRALLNRGKYPRGRIMSDASFTEFSKKLTFPSDSSNDEHYGLGIRIEDKDGHKVLSHSGGMLGFCSYVTIDMDDGLGAVLLANAVHGGSWHNQITEFALRCEAEGLHGRKLPKPTDVELGVPLRNPRQYAGVYKAANKRIVIKTRGHRLAIETSTGSADLQALEPDVFYTNKLGLELFPIRFGRQKGIVSEVAHGGDWYPGRRFRGKRYFRTPRAWEALVGHYRSHDPWVSNFRIFTRKGALLFSLPDAKEEPLTRLADGSYRIGADGRSPERIWFDSMQDGKTMRAIMPGGEWYRVVFP